MRNPSTRDGLGATCRKIIFLLCATAIALPPPAWGMVRGKHVDHAFEDSVTYAFKAVFHTEEDGTLSTHPQPPTQGRSQVCLTYQGQLEPLRECFEGKDQRVRIPQPDLWPYTIHGQMESRSAAGVPFSGSGILVGPHHFLTAAHCVYDGRKMHGWARSLTVYLALNDASAPFGAARGVKAYVYQQWVENEDPDFDIALVILESSIGNETGWAGMMALPEEELRDRKVHVTGYPGDPGKRNQLWTMEDTLDHIDPETFSYKMHTSGGQSGGGIWIKQLASPVVVGVHTMGYVGRNFGVRLSREKLQNMITWMEETGTRADIGRSSGASSSSVSCSATDQQDAEKKFRQGLRYANGDGVAKDDGKAVRLYRLAADKGYATAQCFLGFMYAEGRGVEKNGHEAISWYRKAVDQGHANAQCNLGVIYYRAEGLLKDEGERLLRLAAEQEFVEAQFWFGELTYRSFCGVESNREAVLWLRKAAEKGHVGAQYRLGDLYMIGNSVVEENKREAVLWLRKAADQGHAEAQHTLGKMYEFYLTPETDVLEAVIWYRKAAEQGNAKAQHRLGGMYRSGRGVAKDESKAVFWFRKAADQRYAEAEYDLGEMYAEGRGVKKDKREAARLWQCSADHGYSLAEEKLKSCVIL